MKARIITAIAAFGFMLAGLFGFAQIAQAKPQVNLSNVSVASQSKTCITAWDHIDGNGRPYGKSQVRCSGSFTHTVDWDMFCWPPGYQLRVMATSGKITKDNTSDNCRKISTATTYVIWTVKD